MIPDIRKKYNGYFVPEKYKSFLQDLDSKYEKILFRIAETPVFIPEILKSKIQEACDDIISVLCRDDFKEISKNAVPANQNVPNEDDHTRFLAIDFAVCKDENGELSPQLIELQGFPSLFGFQNFLAEAFRAHFFVPENFTHLFGNNNETNYWATLREVILGDYSAENVILLEIEPEKQKTKIDFLITKDKIGIKPVCISEIIKENRKLYYMDNGRKIPIYCIYNRVIFDELERRTDLPHDFNLTDEVDVEWAGHPNWFFRISKYTLPFITSKYVPETTFLNELSIIPEDLENYVLKPLYSFAGAGVKFNVAKADIEEIENKRNYILQKKVKYEPIIAAADGGLVKVEMRMLFVWKKNEKTPILLTNLARLSRGDMIGVDYNKDKTWVGGTVGFFER